MKVIIVISILALLIISGCGEETPVKPTILSEWEKYSGEDKTTICLNNCGIGEVVEVLKKVKEIECKNRLDYGVSCPNLMQQSINWLLDEDVICKTGCYIKRDEEAIKIIRYAYDERQEIRHMFPTYFIDKEMEKCYNKGKNVSIELDLIKDYNLTCGRIEYINEHFLLSTDQRDVGSMEAYYSGFFSSGRAEAQYYQWVYKEIVATGRLVKKMSYHLDCNNNTFSWNVKPMCEEALGSGNQWCILPPTPNIDTKKVEYYTEADYIVYYAMNCLE